MTQETLLARPFSLHGSLIPYLDDDGIVFASYQWLNENGETVATCDVFQRLGARFELRPAIPSNYRSQEKDFLTSVRRHFSATKPIDIR